jgi:phage terminase large subunit
VPVETIDLGYRAREQFVPFHRRKQRWSCIVAHRRAGKTVACVMDLIDAALSTDKPAARFAYVAPYYAQAKDVAWGYVKQFTSLIPGAEANESELRVDLPNGSRVRLYGADNYDRMRGLYLDGLVLDEVADMDPRAWSEVLRPALSDRKGWAVFIGTPKGPNSFYDLWQDAQKSDGWFALMLKASETGILQPDELEDAKRTMSRDQFRQEYECSFEAAVKGAYYAAEIEEMREQGRICRIPIDRYAEVDTSWDLGIRDQTAIWFVQRVGAELRLVDYYEASGVGLPHYTDYLREWGEKHKARFGRHYLPHDVQAHELSSGRSRLATLHDLGLRNVDVVPQHAVLDGVNAVRRMLPKVWIDEERCSRGLRCLQMYRSDIDEKTGAFKPRPVHDEYSHGADALRYFAASYQDRGKPKGEAKGRYRIGDRAKPTSWMTA